MSTIDRYILGRVVWKTGAILAVGLLILMSERLLRLFDLFSGPDDVVRYLGRMLVLLMPHYIGIVLPAAFFFAVLLTFSRLSKEQELSALLASGTSVPRLTKPVGLLAMGMACLAVVLLGYAQPHARYAYRSIKHNLAQTSLGLAVKEGSFLQIDGLTFFAEASLDQGNRVRLARIFVLDSENGQDQRLTTAREGELIPAGVAGDPVLRLDDGLRLDFEPDGSMSMVDFEEFRWPLARSPISDYRARGGDPRELTFPELFAASVDPPSYLTPAEISAELNSRLIIIVSTLVLAVLAVAMGVGRGWRQRDLSAFIGLVLLIVYNESLEFGESLVKRDQAPAWLALWVPFLLLTTATILAYREAAFRLPAGRTSFSNRLIDRITAWRQAWLQAARRRA